MKISVFEVEEWERPTFEKLGDGHDLRMTTDPLHSDNIDDHKDAEVISTFIHSKYTCDVLEKLANLKLIATRSTGYDHIDLAQCGRQNVTVCNVPTYGENTVAEHVFGLLLSISHNLAAAIDRTRKGDFSQEGLRGFDLTGKILGLVGTGNIGRCVIEIANGFRMNVKAFDIKPDRQLADDLGFEYVDLNQLLEQSDVITLHVPSTDKTHHMISTDEFARMKDGVILINTARGSLIDMKALMHALAEDKVAAAGLDVLPEEPVIREEAELLRAAFSREHNLEDLLAGHILLRLRNVIVTPHSAFNTREAVQRILDTTVDNITAFTEGKPQNVVNE
jgi:D-lactate dehydrogenase